MTDGSTDDARRVDIARRAHLGLREDLEDLRADLADALPDFEKRLHERSSSIPEWLKLSPGHLRSLFYFSDEDIEVEAIIGPRTVAIAAGHLEGFVERWFERIEENPEDFDKEGLVADYEELTEGLVRLEENTHHQIARAQHTFAQWRDEILVQLEFRRKNEVEAIEELIQEGEIPQGTDARQEIADLWEDQRHRAAQLDECWDPLVELLDEGAIATGEGLDLVGEMLERARQGLIGAVDELADSLEPVDIGPAGGDERNSAADADAATRVDGASAVTAPGDFLEDEESTGLGESTSEESHRADVPETPDTIPDEDFLHGIIPIEEPSSGSEEGSLETSSVSDYSEPQRAGSKTPTEPPSSRPYTRPGPWSRRRDDEPTERAERDESQVDDKKPEAPDKEFEPASGDDEETVEEPTASSESPDRPQIEGGCFRFQFELTEVGVLELLAVLAAPTLFVASVALLQLLHLAGVEAAFDPLERWSWAPAALAVAGAWIVLVPLVLSWRVRWEGFRPRIVRRDEVRRVAQITLSDQKLCIDDTCWSLDRLDRVHLLRWDVPRDETFGWLLTFEPRGARRVELATAEDDRHAWQNSPVELAELSYDAWQLDPETFEAIRAALVDTVTE
ncbi:MAG: hypothetical protein ACOCV2_01640 [Persicimonas sp.]